MTDLRYRAYISYSHKDEVWAAWLHRALESYRVPRNLVGHKSVFGAVPSRIRPVFRDRDDLSSATDLGGTVSQALAESENLIVVCSPDAAASHWVNEEIRQFAQLGRTDRIFCIIVNGEPADDGSVSNCFPTALKEIGFNEPLAADVRKWADGKYNAKLKLIAGLLGLRLDELLQRDLHRRRKRRTIFSLGFIAVLILAVVTVLSQISERQERQKAEQLATAIVDLGERVQSEASLETRAVISTLAAEHLEGLDPDKLSPDTAAKVAIAIRQMGLVSQGQGKPEEAMAAFQRSRNLFASLVNKYPDRPNMLFQLGNAGYYIGNLHMRQGRYDSALVEMQAYYRHSLALYEADPENTDWIMELSFAHNNLAAVRLEGGRVFDEETQEHMTEAVRLMEMVVAAKPDDEAVADYYATVLAWAADAQTEACNLEKAITLRGKVTSLRKDSSRSDPRNSDLKRRYAYDLSGLGSLHLQLGRLVLAEQHMSLAVSKLQQLVASDPSNVPYQEAFLVRQFWLAKVIGENGRPEKARLLLQELVPKMRPNEDSEIYNKTSMGEYIDLLITLAEIESRLGERQTASRHLQTAMTLQLDMSESLEWDNTDYQRVLRAKYLWWDQNGPEGLDLFAVPEEARGESDTNFRSCVETDIAARTYMVEDNSSNAAKQVKYLQGKGYAEPGFIRFCTKYALCDG